MRGHRLSPSARSLSHAHIHARHHLPSAMRLSRRSSPPCPNASGETIGTGLELTLSCGSSLDGSVLDTIDEAETLEACANFCGTFHPRCDGVNFSEEDGCRLIGGAGGAGEGQSSFDEDSAVAKYPSLPSSSCSDGENTAQGGQEFDAMCGQIINGGDMVQRHKRTYDECADECADTTDCMAFSFEPGMEQGFMNCYLKSEFDDSSLSFVEGVDSGLMGAGNASSPGEATSSEIPNSGGFFSVVPPGNAANPTVAQSSAAEPSQSVPETTQTPVVTQVVTAPLDSASASAEAEAEAGAGAEAESGSANLSWVAAPVVGGVAAMLVVGVLLIMFRKRRNGGKAKAGGWKGMLGLGGKQSRGMQRLSDTESRGMESRGVESRGVPVYEVKDGRMALRDSGDSGQRPMTGLFRTSG